MLQEKKRKCSFEPWIKWNKTLVKNARNIANKLEQYNSEVQMYINITNEQGHTFLTYFWGNPLWSIDYRGCITLKRGGGPWKDELKATSLKTQISKLKLTLSFITNNNYLLKSCAIHTHNKLKYLFTSSFNNSNSPHRSTTTSRLYKRNLSSWRNNNENLCIIFKQRSYLQGNQRQKALQICGALQF